MAESVIATLPKNSTEELRVVLSHFKGHDLVHVRTFLDVPGKADRVPTHKGIVVRVEQLPALQSAIGKALAVVRANGLLEEEEESAG